jgi:hypothetical protein
MAWSHSRPWAVGPLAQNLASIEKLVIDQWHFYLLLLAGSDQYVLKANSTGKADIWQKFSIVHQKVDASSSDQPHDSKDEVALNYTACNKCLKVYQLKDSSGKPLGTKNLLEHGKRCAGALTHKQLQIQQCMVQKPTLSTSDLALLKQKQAEYCFEGYNSFRSVENKGLLNLMQTCADFGARYGKIDIKSVAYKRKAVANATTNMALKLKGVIHDNLQQPIRDGTVSLCIDMYTDDYRKRAYVDVHASWIDVDFTLHHTAIAIRHFGTAAHTGDNISMIVHQILDEYSLPADDTPVTTDHGSNIVAALKNNIRLDCACHRLHTVLETSWRDTKQEMAAAAAYDEGMSDLCRYVKQATGIQEQLPKSIKHGGDTRPWTSMNRRAESVDASYDSLVNVLKEKNRLELIANVNRSLNTEILQLTNSIVDVFMSLEKVNEPTLQYVAPSYYLLQERFRTLPCDSSVIKTFKKHLRTNLDDKLWTSINALHWMASFLDPSFKQFEFVPQKSNADTRFRYNLLKDLDSWMETEMATVVRKLQDRDENSRSMFHISVNF